MLGHHLQQIDKLQQIKNHEQVSQEDEIKTTEDCQNDIAIPDKYVDRSYEFPQLLSDLDLMWGERFGRVNTARHRIELTFTYICQVHSASYWASPAARQFTVWEIQKMFPEKTPSQLV